MNKNIIGSLFFWHILMNCYCIYSFLSKNFSFTKVSQRCHSTKFNFFDVFLFCLFSHKFWRISISKCDIGMMTMWPKSIPTWVENSLMRISWFGLCYFFFCCDNQIKLFLFAWMTIACVGNEKFRTKLASRSIQSLYDEFFHVIHLQLVTFRNSISIFTPLP